MGIFYDRPIMNTNLYNQFIISKLFTLFTVFLHHVFASKSGRVSFVHRAWERNPIHGHPSLIEVDKDAFSIIDSEILVQLRLTSLDMHDT